MATIEERILSKVWLNPDNDCWEWQGAKAGRGYGVIHLSNPRRNEYVHRVMYELYVGIIPDGLPLDHFICDNKICCNPFHVRPASHRENNLRSDGMAARNASKNKCPEGHEYDWIDSRGHRQCKTCRRKQFLDFKQRKLNEVS